MISFEKSEKFAQMDTMLETVAENMMRPVARYFDEQEHEIPWDYINFMHEAMRAMGMGSRLVPDKKEQEEAKKKKRPSVAYQRMAHMIEMA